MHGGCIFVRSFFLSFAVGFAVGMGALLVFFAAFAVLWFIF